MLGELVSELRETLRVNLVGVYLYGSLTQRAFDRKRSDVDCLVVVRRNLSGVQFRRLARFLARAAESDPWVKRLQMQVLVESGLLKEDKRGILYQFGILKRSGSDGNPIIWSNVLATGITLAGPAPASILPPITREKFDDALRREVGYVRAEFGNPRSKWRDVPFYRRYAVLTACRILYSFRTGTVASKPRAAAWALRNVPFEWHPLVRRALSSDRDRLADLPRRRITQLIEFVDARVKSK